jgi:hypothetical protein
LKIKVAKWGTPKKKKSLCYSGSSKKFKVLFTCEISFFLNRKLALVVRLKKYSDLLRINALRRDPNAEPGEERKDSEEGE